MKPFFVTGLTVCALTLGLATGYTAAPRAAARPASDEAIVHMLNRLGYGARLGQVERARALGIERYIDEQLQPDRIADTGIAPRLAGLETVRMSSADIVSQIERPVIEARRNRKQQSADSTQPPMPPEPVQQKANSVVVELSEQKILRAVYSERQLQEVLADFWFNHFNVDARKGRDRFLVTEYEREAIRPHVLGRFRDLLGATAKSPAMLFYLDNWISGAQKGINENYARELMELHTLGVDGGYTQEDVIAVARAFTGWTIVGPRQGGDFRFEPRIHDMKEKVVLGQKIKAGGGESDGERVLDILAKHPSTARFISTKLARRFVSDTPPPALVDRAAARFRETDGDIREVVRTILTSPEFFSADAYRAKVKSPFEFVVSAVRATGTEVSDAMALTQAVRQLGMPLYMCQPPTGYPDKAEAWVNTGALLNRMNFALQLVGGRMRGIQTGTSPVGAALADDLSPSTAATVAKATDARQIAALTLGSPEFQRR
jgi:uncharacterized protein (DUF1800 family)